jgi:hypothetical protein
MVPVFFDKGRGKMKVWAFLGWAQREVTIDFAEPPRHRIRDGEGRDAGARVRLEFVAAQRCVVEPVSAECYVSRLLDRDEFRAHCDRYRSVGRAWRRAGSPIVTRPEILGVSGCSPGPSVARVPRRRSLAAGHPPRT